MKITMIGSGNVATHLAAAFKNAGHRILQVYSRDKNHADLLAYHVKAEAIDDLKNLDPDTSIFIIAVKDDAIEAIAQQLASFIIPMVHTSGNTALSTIAAFDRPAGVLYPLQTFSKLREVDMRQVPVCVEATDDGTLHFIEDLARSISNNVTRVNSADRRILHLASVFACNFSNHLYAVAHNILAAHQLNFNLLRPLIAETAAKALENSPAKVQTGPAVRNDEKTINAHLQLLTGEPQLQALYTLLSQSIIKMENDISHNG